jgi:hypothetical protein
MNMQKVAVGVLVFTLLVLGASVHAEWYPTDKIQDGDFSTDPTSNGWVASPDYFQWLGSVVTMWRPEGYLRQNVTGLTPGVEYKVTADTDFWGEDPRESSLHVYVLVYDSAGTLINYGQRNGGNGWITLEAIFVAPADGQVRVELSGQNHWYDTQVYWDNVVLYSSVPVSAPVWYQTSRIKDGTFTVDPIFNGWIKESGSYSCWPYAGTSGNGVVLYKMFDDDPDALLSQTVTALTAGVQYKVTAETDFWGDVARAADVHVWLNVYDSAGVLLNQAVRNGGNGWIPLEVVFTAPANGIVRVQLTGQNYWWETQAYWDNVILYSSVKEDVPVDPNAGKVQNGDFNNGMTGWKYWRTDGSSYSFGDFDPATNMWTAPSGSVYWDVNFGNPDPGATVFHNPGWGVLGIYQVVPVVPGTEYTIKADWMSNTGMTSGSCYAEFIVYDATAIEVEDINVVLVNSCSNWPQNSILAKKDTFSNLNNGQLPWGWESITKSMGGGFDHGKGVNKITPVNPYLVIIFKFGGNYASGSPQAYFRIDNVRLETPADRIPGDANGDKKVDVSDLGILAANYGGTGKTWELGDFSGDGKVDVSDLGILAAHYGTGTGAVLDFNADAKAIGLSGEAKEEVPVTSDLGCGLAGLPLIVGLLLIGMSLIKLDE